MNFVDLCVMAAVVPRGPDYVGCDRENALKHDDEVVFVDTSDPPTNGFIRAMEAWLGSGQERFHRYLINPTSGNVFQVDTRTTPIRTYTINLYGKTVTSPEGLERHFQTPADLVKIFNHMVEQSDFRNADDILNSELVCDMVKRLHTKISHLETRRLGLTVYDESGRVNTYHYNVEYVSDDAPVTIPEDRWWGGGIEKGQTGRMMALAVRDSPP